jgi:hypothetical protein
VGYLVTGSHTAPEVSSKGTGNAGALLRRGLRFYYLAVKTNSKTVYKPVANSFGHNTGIYPLLFHQFAILPAGERGIASEMPAI